MKNTDFETNVAILPKSNALLYASDVNPRDITQNRFTQASVYAENLYATNYFYFGDYKIEPNGLDNNFPLNYKQLLDNVYLANGIKRTLINLLISSGTGLYQEIKKDDKIIRDWVLDTEVSDWLDSFNFESEYLPELATDMIYIENCYTMFQRNRGARIGQSPKFAALKYLSVEKMRLEYPDETGIRKNVFYGDWFVNQMRPDNLQAIPIFDIQNPFKNPQSVMFIKMPTFGSTAYGRPTDIGAAQLLHVLSLLPNYHRANLTERGFKWLVSISADIYEKVCNDNNWTEDSEEFLLWKQKFTKDIDDFLSAPEGDKVQTRFLTKFKYDAYSNKRVDFITFTKLEDDTKMLSEVGMSLHDTYTIGYVSANAIHPQLANVNLKNQSLSGSNLREAYEMHIKTATPTMRNLLLHAVNTGIKLNFPDKKIKVGFKDMAFDDLNPVKDTKPVINNNSK